MLKLQFLTGKKHNEEWSAVKNCNFSKLKFFKCTFTVISLHIFAVWCYKSSVHVCLWKTLSQNCPHDEIRHVHLSGSLFQDLLTHFIFHRIDLKNFTSLETRQLYYIALQSFTKYCCFFL